MPARIKIHPPDPELHFPPRHRPSRQTPRRLHHILLTVPASHPHRVQLQQLPRVILVRPVRLPLLPVLPPVQIKQHRRTQRRRPQHLPERPHRMLPDHLPVIRTLEPLTIQLRRINVEMIRPEPHHHFIQLPLRMHRPDHRTPRQFIIQLRRLVLEQLRHRHPDRLQRRTRRPRIPVFDQLRLQLLLHKRRRRVLLRPSHRPHPLVIPRPRTPRQSVQHMRHRPDPFPSRHRKRLQLPTPRPQRPHLPAPAQHQPPPPSPRPAATRRVSSSSQPSSYPQSPFAIPTLTAATTAGSTTGGTTGTGGGAATRPRSPFLTLITAAPNPISRQAGSSTNPPATGITHDNASTVAALRLATHPSTPAPLRSAIRSTNPAAPATPANTAPPPATSISRFPNPPRCFANPMKTTTPTTTPAPTRKHRTGRRIRSAHRPVNSGNNPRRRQHPRRQRQRRPKQKQGDRKDHRRGQIIVVHSAHHGRIPPSRPLHLPLFFLPSFPLAPSATCANHPPQHLLTNSPHGIPRRPLS
jgi:hypothetical protein